MEFQINYDEYWYVSLNETFSLDPEEFLDCNDRNELKCAIREYCMDSINCPTGNIEYLEESSYTLEIPESFYKEWERLKYGKPSIF